MLVDIYPMGRICEISHLRQRITRICAECRVPIRPDEMYCIKHKREIEEVMPGGEASPIIHRDGRSLLVSPGNE